MIAVDRETRWQVLTGVLLGCCVTIAVLPLIDAGGGSAPVESGGTLLSDCDGSLQQLVVHFVPSAAAAVLPTYREFLARLPGDVTVYVVCPDRAAFAALREAVGPTACGLEPVIVDHPLTTWSRDRWLALAGRQGRIRLLAPQDERAAGVWPARAGDRRVAADLAAALGGEVIADRSELHFDGGDFVSDAETVFVAPSVRFRNLQQTVASADDLRNLLRAETGRQVVLLETAPDHHTGMFLMPIGQRTVLVGDPSAAWRILDRQPGGVSARDGLLPDGILPDDSPETQLRFDAVAAQCRSRGYRVVRMPLVPGDDGRTWLSYLNVILDQRQGRRTVYLPVFAGAEPLNAAASEIWKGQGFQVRLVDCTACAPHFGTLRCLVNVLRRSQTVGDGELDLDKPFQPHGVVQVDHVPQRDIPAGVEDHRSVPADPGDTPQCPANLLQAGHRLVVHPPGGLAFRPEETHDQIVEVLFRRRGVVRCHGPRARRRRNAAGQDLLHNPEAGGPEEKDQQQEDDVDHRRHLHIQLAAATRVG